MKRSREMLLITRERINTSRLTLTDSDVKILDKDKKTIIITISPAFKKLSTDVEDIKRAPNHFLWMKTTTCEMKNKYIG